MFIDRPGFALQLTDAVKAKFPDIDGVSVGRKDDCKTWRVTPEQPEDCSDEIKAIFEAFEYVAPVELTPIERLQAFLKDNPDVLPALVGIK
jgi:hypothetical protein